MPEAEIARRGGAVRVRTQRLSGGRYRHIFIVRDAGPRGGHTVAGEVQRSRSAKDRDDAPSYRVKPKPYKPPLRRRNRASKS